jgi:hypothetical protein
VLHDLQETHHGEVAHMGDEMGPLGREPIAPEPEHLEGGERRAEVAHELGAVDVA